MLSVPDCDAERRDGKDVMGTIEVLSTPAGNILKELLKAGIKLGISSRGLGSVEELYEDGMDGAVKVQDDFELICWDVVTSPSTPGSWIYPEAPTRDQQLSESTPEKSSNILIDSLDAFLCD